MNEQHDAVSAADRAAETMARDVYALGRSWADYGLTVGRMAVVQSARSLEQVARVLEGAADLLASLSKQARDGERVVVDERDPQ